MTNNKTHLIDLFPKDLNPYFDPHNFEEEKVEPKKFSNLITGILNWTVGIPLFLFLSFQSQYITDISINLDKQQQVFTNLISTYISQEIQNKQSLLANTAQTLLLINDSSDYLKHLENKSHIYFQTFHSSQRLNDFLHSIQKDAGIYFITKDKNEKPLLLWTFLPSSFLQALCPINEFSFALVNQNGSLLFSNHRLDTWSNINNSFKEIQDNNNKNISLWKTNGTRSISVVRSIAFVPEHHWYVVIDQPVSVRDAEIRKSSAASGFLFILALILSVIVGKALSRPLSQRVSEISTSVEQFAKTGKIPEISDELKKQGPTELFDFATLFKKAAEEINRHRHYLRNINSELEQRIKERTFSLTIRNKELQELHTLLAPIEGHTNTVIEKIIKEFEQIFQFDKLEFSQENTTGVLVKNNNIIYGSIIANPHPTSEQMKSLERLANSIAVVLSNQTLYNTTQEQQKTLELIFASMSEGIALLRRDGKLFYQNSYLATLVPLHINRNISFFRNLLTSFSIQNLEHSTRPIVSFEANTTYRIQHKEKQYILEAKVFNIPSHHIQAINKASLCLVIRDITRDAQLESLKEQLISTVAHELKTPITALRLQAETLAKQKQLSETEQLSILNDMQQESDRLRKLVDDWLDISRLENGMVHLKPKITHIATPIKKATKLVQTRFSINVHVDIEEDSECFLFDPDRMTQVFINLMSNAARYAHPNTIANIFIHVQKVSDTIQISIKDQGIGISKDKIPHIFKRFYQADMSHLRRPGGTGLGLAIVKGIIEAHNGSIQVNSRLGEFTEFIITMPY